MKLSAPFGDSVSPKYAFQTVGLIVMVALVLSLTFVGTFQNVSADHGPFDGTVLSSQSNVTICHTGNGKKYTQNAPNVDSIIAGGNSGHGGPNHTQDIIPPFHYDIGNGEETYSGKNWSPETEDIWASGECNGDGVVEESVIDLEVTKEVDNANPAEGDTVTFTVTVANLGPDSATDVVVSDLLPSGVTYVSDSASQGSYNESLGEWTVGSLAINAVATLTIEVTVNTATGGTDITNTASGTAVESDTDTSNDSDSATVSVQEPVIEPEAGVIIIAKEVTEDSDAEKEFTFSSSWNDEDFTLAHFEATSTELVPGTYSVSEAETAGWTLESAVCESTDGADTSTPDAIVLDDGETITCTFTNDEDEVVTEPAEGDLVVVKTVINDDTGTSTVSDFTLSVFDGTSTTTVTSGATTTLEVGSYVVSESGPGSYTATFGGDCDASGNVTVLENQTVTCTITNDDIAADVDAADLALTKEVDDATPESGQQITYTINVTNHGPDTAEQVEVIDALPAGLSFVSASSTVGAYNENDNVWAVGTMLSGATETLDITVTVEAESGTINNKALADLDPDIDINADNNEDDVDITVEDDTSGGGGTTTPQTFTLTVTTSGDGNGIVLGENEDISCDSNPDQEAEEENDCEEIYEEGTEVTITAHPDDNSHFDNSWSGACTGNNPVCVITMNSDQSVDAHFSLESGVGGDASGGGGGGSSNGGGSSGGGGGGGSSSSSNTNNDGAVLGASTGPTDTGEVLGDQIAIVPQGAPNTGFGGATNGSMSMTASGTLMLILGLLSAAFGLRREVA